MFRGKVILCRCGSIDGLENPVLHVSGQQLAYSHLLSGRHRPAPGNIPLQIKFIGGIEEHPSTRARKRLGGIPFLEVSHGRLVQQEPWPQDEKRCAGAGSHVRWALIHWRELGIRGRVLLRPITRMAAALPSVQPYEGFPSESTLEQ